MLTNAIGEGLRLDEVGHNTDNPVPDLIPPALGYVALEAPQLAFSKIAREGFAPNEDTYTKYHNSTTYEVVVESSIRLEDYERVTPPEDMERLKAYAEKMQGREIMFVNATPEGGGVAIMRAPLVHLLNLLGVNARWYALMPDEDKQFFKVTKQKFHNVLQNVVAPDVRLTEDDIDLYNRVIEDNAKVLEGPLSTADVIIVDDWQPKGLIPYIKGGEVTTSRGTERHPGYNPDGVILFRDHIQTEGALMGTPGTPQNDTWKFIWDNQVDKADVFITHPMDEFVPPDVPDRRVVFMPATVDLLDDLNRPLTSEEQQRGFDFINGQLADNENQTPLDLDRPYIVLIARFDPSKGMPEGMESYAKARALMVGMGVSEKELPQLVVLGNGSIDDPDGIPLLAEMMSLRLEQYGAIMDDIKIARVPHNDLAINTLLSRARLALQPSTKEGFEARVTDAIVQGVPVIGSDRGGIPLQIIPGKSGYVVDPYNTDQWATHITDLLTDPAAYVAMRNSTLEAAKTFNSRFTTPWNAIRWLHLSHMLLTDKPNFVGNRQWVEDIAA